MSPASLIASQAPTDHKTLTRYEYKEYHMGVDVRIVAYAPDLPTAEKACTAAFARFAELDSIMSDYRVNSELTLLCNKSGGPPVKISRDLFIVLERAQEVARKSGGAFDVTCGPLIRLWREARRTSILPTADQIAHARSLCGWRKLKLDRKSRTARLMVAGMKLDLGGIAKGYADDCAQEALKKNGVTRALVEAGGDIVVSDPPPGASGWKIEVPNAEPENTNPENTKDTKGKAKDTKEAARHSEGARNTLNPSFAFSRLRNPAGLALLLPAGFLSREQPVTNCDGQALLRNDVKSTQDAGRRASEPAKEAPVLTFANCAVSTSGDLFQSVVVGGKRYSHIIDPRTGQALTDRIQVTIVAKDGLTSDPLSKVVSVLGPNGQHIAEKWPGVRKVWVRHLGQFE